MTTRHTTAGRRARAQKRPKTTLIIGVAALLIVVLVGGLAAIGRSSTDQSAAATGQPITLSDHPAPANAEPKGQAWGPADAPIKVVEYADYACPACGYFARTNEPAVVKAFAATGKVRFEVHQTPFHGQGSRNASAAAYCAAEQDAFWPMHNTMFANQPTAETTIDQAFSVPRLTEMARKLGLDSAAFGQCLSSGKYTAQVEADYQATGRAGVDRTPTFVINGKPFVGVQTVDDLRRIFAEVAPGVNLDR